jgi:hypothetical protein
MPIKSLVASVLSEPNRCIPKAVGCGLSHLVYGTGSDKVLNAAAANISQPVYFCVKCAIWPPVLDLVKGVVSKAVLANLKK